MREIARDVVLLNQVTALLEDGLFSFPLSAGATLEDLVGQLAGLWASGHGPAIAVNVKFSQSGGRQIAPRQPAEGIPLLIA